MVSGECSLYPCSVRLANVKPVPVDDPSSPESVPDSGSASDKWLVRILLFLAFGLAFGIEGMTLVRSYVLDREAGQDADATEEHVSLREGDVLVPGLAPSVRVRQLHVRAGDDAWTFFLRARPDSALQTSYTLSLDQLTTSDGTVYGEPVRHTWTPPDTASFEASWALPVGQRPTTLTMTATVEGEADSTASGTRTVDVGYVPVRRQ